MRQRIVKTWLDGRVWLVPGMGVKRWLGFLVAAVMVVALGLLNTLLAWRAPEAVTDAMLRNLLGYYLPTWARTAGFITGGLLLFMLALNRLARNVLAPLQRPDETVGSSLASYARGRRGPRIVAIGGGTGLPALLRGLQAQTSNITAVVTVADDGGSSGRLRREYGLLPPGDFRNNIAALARDEALITQLLQFRFGAGIGSESSALEGHALGNLLLAALTQITGSFDTALLAINRVLALRGRVLPATLEPVVLSADVRVAGVTQRVVGESHIPDARGTVQRVYLDPADVRVYPPVIQAILQADLIVLGPGSLYTSVLPNLLVPGLAAALRQAKAPRVYVCNIATQPGETDGYGAREHVAALQAHTSADIVDYVVANGNLTLAVNPETILVQPTEPARARLIVADLVDEARPWRHDSDKLCAALLGLLGSRGAPGG